MKRFSERFLLIGGLSVFFLGGAAGVSASASLKEISAYLDEGIRLIISGVPFTAQDSEGNRLAPINYNGNLYVPLRAMADAVGMKVKWDHSQTTASIGAFQEDEGNELYISSDTRFQITLPHGWIRNDVLLQQGSPPVSFGAIFQTAASLANLGVVGESKTVSGESLDVGGYSEAVLDKIKGQYENLQVRSQVDLKINNYPAKQYEIYMHEQNMKMGYIITFIETDNQFYQVRLWRSADNDLGTDQEEFAQIAATFKERSH
jgi:hypothetical protein